jgi:hypothetical protein
LFRGAQSFFIEHVALSPREAPEFEWCDTNSGAPSPDLFLVIAHIFDDFLLTRITRWHNVSPMSTMFMELLTSENQGVLENRAWRKVRWVRFPSASAMFAKPAGMTYASLDPDV